jgi:CRISPR system Cascade subunit CasC
MFIELHLIQNFAPANLNRDDTNNPKDCEFGGHRRARISSQALKRAIRFHPAFRQTTQVELGERTRWMTHLLAKPLLEAGKSREEAQTVAAVTVAAYYSKKEKMDAKNPKRTTVLVYISPDEVKALSQTILENWDTVLAAATAEKKDKTIANLVDPLVKATKDRTSAPDIALFGRMLADRPELSLDAACQVAHAISTHRVTMEMDYFTAVDDLLARDEGVGEEGEEEVGAGMVGFTSFNSACFYRYVRIDWEQLIKNLADDKALARRTVEGFLQAALEAIPSGKQNSFAAHNPTSFALAVVREDGMGWSLANAFETPIRPRNDTGLITPSIEKLDTYWGRLCQFYGDGHLRAISACHLDGTATITHLKEALKSSRSEWVETITGVLLEE